MGIGVTFEAELSSDDDVAVLISRLQRATGERYSNLLAISEAKLPDWAI